MLRETEIGVFVDTNFENATHLIHVTTPNYVLEILENRIRGKVVNTGEWHTRLNHTFVFSRSMWQPVVKGNTDAPTIEDIKKQLQLC